MTVEKGVCSEESGVSNVGIEGKCGLDMGSQEDLSTAGAECNGVAHREVGEGINGSGKDEADDDPSYVFVNGNDVDPVAGDPSIGSDLNAEDGVELNASESNVCSQNGTIEVRGGDDSSDRNGESVKLHGEDECIVENSEVLPSKTDLVQGAESSVENGECDRQACGKDDCIAEGESVENDESVRTVEGSVIFPSKSELALDNSKSHEPDGEEVTRSDPIAEEQNGVVVVEPEPERLDGVVEVEEQVQLEPSAECELLPADDAEMKLEQQNKCKSTAETEETQQSAIPSTNSAESETGDDAEVKFEPQNNLESTAETEEKQQSSIPSSDSADSELLQSSCGLEKVEEESKLDPIMDVGENKEGQSMAKGNAQADLEQEAHVIADEDVHADLEQEPQRKINEGVHVDSDSENKAIESANRIFIEVSTPGDVAADLVLNSVMAEGDVSHLGAESAVATGLVLAENGDNCPTHCTEDCVSKTVTINDSDGGIQNASALNSSSENGESLLLPVHSVRSENEVGSLPIESSDNLHEDNNNKMLKEVGEEAPLVNESFPSCDAETVGLETAVDGSVEDESLPSCPANVVKSDIIFGSMDFEEKVPTLSSGDANVEFKFSNGFAGCASKQPTCHSANVKSELEVESTSALSCRDMPSSEISSALSSSGDMPSADNTLSESKFSAGSVVNSDSASNTVPNALDVENEEDQLPAGDRDDKQMCQEAEGTERHHRDETATSSAKSSCADALDGHSGDADAGKRPFNYLIRIPRYDDEKFRKQINLAELQVEERTQSRDIIRGEIQMKRAACKEYAEKFEAAISEEKAIRDSLKSKRQEIDAVQSMVNKVKNAVSVDDIDGRIRNMEHAIEHESLQLTVEKHYLREIKQLKHVREQLSYNMGKQDELKEAMDQRDQFDERSKFLRKEADSLKDRVSKAEVITKAAKKIYFDEKGKLSELQAQFKIADDIRQQAYANLRSMKKEFNEKNKYFWMYRDDAEKARKYASDKNKDKLHHLCVNQVERIMDLWNNNDDFRREYIRCNTRSTLRRLKTLDGRSLGPDEELPVPATVLSEKVDNRPPTPPLAKASTVDEEKEVVRVEVEKADGPATSKAAKIKKHARPALLHNGSATISGRNEGVEDDEEPKQSKEEAESARKEEELRKKEAAAKLREQRQLEELAKAKEAQERKKRNAEKAQAKAELRAQKEADQKEKEREKRARKKERKKAAAEGATNGSIGGESAANSHTQIETTKEHDSKEKSVAVTKRPQKPTKFTKPTKTKSIPLPLRNRGKRRMQQWMWIAAIVLLVILAIFVVLESNFSFPLWLQRFGS